MTPLTPLTDDAIRERLAADHHPDIDIRYSRVTLALTTHDAGGLTARDFELAAQIWA
jgi:4a-hydroxytetrahydrobiopterin dehydratase